MFSGTGDWQMLLHIHKSLKAVGHGSSYMLGVDYDHILSPTALQPGENRMVF